MISYLSPTSLSLFLKDREEFYQIYISGNKKERELQNQAMSIGSAFDSYIKSYLHESLFGKGNDPKYNLKDLFESQVEEQNRTFAWENGKYIFEQYKSSGALSDLMLELQKAQGTPRFEFSVFGVVSGRREGVFGSISGVPFLGKPDASFVSSEGIHVILDFKVNGFCSNYAMSPIPGYVRLRRAGNTNFGAHKQAILQYQNGILINIADTLDNFKEDWARQLAIYSWLLGEPIGSDFIVAIDQILCTPSKAQNLNSNNLPEIKVAEHRCRISESYQHQLFQKAVDAWDTINSNHFFRELSLEDSQARCSLLDSLNNPETQVHDPWIDSLGKKAF